MIKRIIQEKQGLPIPATKGLPAENSRKTPTLIRDELNLSHIIRRRRRIPRVVGILFAIVAFVITVQANVIDLKVCLIGLAVLVTLWPALRRLRNR